MMTKFDEVYKEMVLDIYNNGVTENPENVRPVYEDGEPAPTRAILNKQLKFDASEFPILSQKRAGVKDATRELLWIWKDMSNKVQDLRDAGCNVWNEWELEDGTIGKAYGWQLANKKRQIVADELFVEMFKNGEFSASDSSFTEEDYDELRRDISKREHIIELNQVDYLLYQLKKNPHSRRIKTTLYCIEDLDKMALEPCVYETHWQLWDGTLNLTVNIRSNDVALGNPYNVSQYAILHRMIAQVTGHTVGELCFNIDNAHIYTRHFDSILDQIEREAFDAPTVTLNPEIKSLFEFTVEDVIIENYQHSGTIRYEVAI